ncbi:hypothetical protein Tco_0512732, partial [Tanacetum coccineum]
SYTPYQKTWTNSRPLPDFEEYVVSNSSDMPYMKPWSTFNETQSEANTPYPEQAIRRIRKTINEYSRRFKHGAHSK